MHSSVIRASARNTTSRVEHRLSERETISDEFEPRNDCRVQVLAVRTAGNGDALAVCDRQKNGQTSSHLLSRCWPAGCRLATLATSQARHDGIPLHPQFATGQDAGPVVEGIIAAIAWRDSNHCS